jgi:hypothetical protein
MNSQFETGLFLPLRFYHNLSEQDRYKRLSEGVALADQCYIHADCVTLCPFQIILKQYCEEGIATITNTLICIDGTETALSYTAASWELWSDTTNRLSYLSYLGDSDFTGQIGNGKYYIKLTIVDMCGYTNTYYSDIFIIRNCGSVVPTYDTVDYRITSPSDDDKRMIDTTNPNDLRIIKE